MADGNPEFYGETIDRLLGDGLIGLDSSILVVCGGPVDRQVLVDRGFTNVTISNIDSRQDPKGFDPYPWSYQDAEQLSCEDGSFDVCIVHSGLHHCRSPHRGLVEMYRVARRGVLLFEPYDNLFTRLGIRLNIGQEYEHASVARNGFAFGGVANSAIPNFVYRFTEKEILKTVSCYEPTASPDVKVFHRMRIPWGQLKARPKKGAYYAARLATPLLRLVERVFPAQSNNFAAFITKPDLPADLHPWLREDGDSVVLDERWVAERYGS